MCLACYGMGAAPETAAPVPKPTPPAPPVVRFSVPEQQWSCFPSGQMGGMQLIPPPPMVAQSAMKAPEPPAPAPAKTGQPKKKKSRPAVPPSLLAGAAYVFPRKHTYVHVIRDVKVWEAGAGTKWGFKIHRVPTSLSVGEFLDAMYGGDGDATKGLFATEVIELGDMAWSKGLSVEYGSDKAAATMASFGWNEKRGGDNSLPPVWLVLHKA